MCADLVNTKSPRMDEPILEEPEPKVILNVDSGTSLMNADFINSVNTQSEMHVDLLPSDIREDLITKSSGKNRTMSKFGGQIQVLQLMEDEQQFMTETTNKKRRTKTITNFDSRVRAFVKNNDQGRKMIRIRDQEKNARFSITQRSRKPMTPGIAVMALEQQTQAESSDSEISANDLLQCNPEGLPLSMEYQDRKMNLPMPALFEQILK